MRRLIVLVPLCLIFMSCPGIKIDFAQWIEGSISTADDFDNWNDGVYYKRYRIKLKSYTPYTFYLWSELHCMLCVQKDGDPGGYHIVSMDYRMAPEESPYYTNNYEFWEGGTLYVFVYVRQSNIEAGEKLDFRFKIEENYTP